MASYHLGELLDLHEEVQGMNNHGSCTRVEYEKGAVACANEDVFA